jgi:hypothetical protein
MLLTIFTHGLIAGLIVGGIMFATTSAMKGHPPPMPVGMAIGYASMLIALSFVFIGVKRHRDQALGGVIKFWPALGMGLAISLIAGVIYVLAWELTLAVTQVDYADHFAKVYVDAARAKGTSGAELAKLIANMETWKAQYANLAYRMPMTFTEILPVGVLVSLFSAALLRNPRFMPARGHKD